jgi:uncharacterized protein (DUF2062 family)
LPIIGVSTFLLRLDMFVAYAVSNISIPPMIPVLLFLEVQVGNWLLRGKFLPFTMESLAPEHAWELGRALALGSLVVGATVAMIGGAIAWQVTRNYLERKTRRQG